MNNCIYHIYGFGYCEDPGAKKCKGDSRSCGHYIIEPMQEQLDAAKAEKKQREKEEKSREKAAA
jgi:hypothetical protein